MEKAVLFLIFNRPDTTAEVFERIRAASPSRLYVAGDGARPDREGEFERVAKARAIATDIDWPCEVKTLFRDENLGCKRAVSGALDWFFEQEEEGIILEDDCVPDPCFFRFCEEMLERYRGEERVATISGNNFVSRGPKDANRYYFSKYFHCWGWATWRRGWELYRGNLQDWPEWHASEAFREWLGSEKVSTYWARIFDECYEELIDSWAYPFQAGLWMNQKFSVQPGTNLVQNVGFGKAATHTTGRNFCPKSCPVLFPLRAGNSINRTGRHDRRVFSVRFSMSIPGTGERNLRIRTREAVKSFPPPVQRTFYYVFSRRYRREEAETRKLSSLLGKPRFVQGEIVLKGKHWHYADAYSFYDSYKSIFVEERLSLRTPRKRPRLIIVGGQVGVLAVFWNSQFPEASLTVLEEDSRLIPFLEENTARLSGAKVSVHHQRLEGCSKAFRSQELALDPKRLFPESRNCCGSSSGAPLTNLCELVGDRRVDALSVDRGGGEYDLLQEGKEALTWVDRIWIRCYSQKNQPQKIPWLISLLANAGYRVWVESEWTQRQPFFRQASFRGFDLCLIVSGVKEALLNK